MAFKDFINANIAPREAKKIGVYKSNNERVGEIELNSLSETSKEPLYKFGLLSDIHTDSTDYNYTTYLNSYPYSDEGYGDLCRALKWLRDKEEVDLICSTGDLSQYGTDSEFAMCQSGITNTIPDIPFYTCTGNHDVYTGHYSATTFNSYTRRSIDTSSYSITNSTAYTNSFCFDKTTTAGTDHFIFFSMIAYSTGSNGTPYLDSDISWLSSKLEEFSGDRVFIFTHLFFPDYAGNLGRVNGSGGIYPEGNWLLGSQLNSLLALFAKYPKAVWFSGHSHWKWDLQKYQGNINVARYGDTGGWSVHVPSCALPIDSDYTDLTKETDNNRVEKPLESQGGVVYVYDNRIVIRGIDFNINASENGSTEQGYTGDTYVRYLPIACYSLYTDGTAMESGTDTTTGKTEIVTTSDFYINGLKGHNGYNISGWTSGSDSYIALIFSAISEGIIYSTEEMGSTMTAITMACDEVKLYSVTSDGTETERSTTDTSYIGWLASYNEDGSSSYSLEANFTATYGLASTGGAAYSAYTWDEYQVSGTGATVLTKYGIQFNTSSKFVSQGITNWDGYSSLGTLGTDWCVKVVFKNLKGTPLYIDTGGTETETGSTTGSTDSGSSAGVNTVLSVTLTTKSTGIGLLTNDSSLSTASVKYDDIKITVNGTDETSSIVSTATTSNSYKVGIYNSNGGYQYAPAGSIVTASVNSDNTVIPLAQVSSSSILSGGSYTIVVQMKNIQYSTDGTNWTAINENTELANGSSWSKSDVSSYEWVSEIS